MSEQFALGLLAQITEQMGRRLDEVEARLAEVEAMLTESDEPQYLDGSQ